MKLSFNNFLIFLISFNKKVASSNFNVNHQVAFIIVKITFKMSLKDFEKVTKLGEGAYSTVYKVIRISDQRTYALKRIKLVSLTQKEKQNALNQIRILASISHPHIIAYKEAFFDEASKSLCIVMEYANFGDLGEKIQEKKKKLDKFSEEDIWNIIGGMIKGLSALHQIGVYHRDIKPANIFLTKSGDNVIAKIGDMNVSKISQQGMCMTQTGTPYYASPEVWKDLPYDEKSDIWSLGCVIYEMAALRPPFQAQDMQQLFKKVTRGIYPKLPSQFSGDLSSLVRVLLQLIPESRPSSSAIFKLPGVLKHVQNLDQSSNNYNNELMKTIKGENFNELNQVLPKANYMPPRQKRDRERGIKSMMNEMDAQTLERTASTKRLPIGKDDQKAIQIGLLRHGTAHKLSKERSLKKYEHTDRTHNKEKKDSIALLNRERKKSQISIGRQMHRAQFNSVTKKSIHGVGDPKDQLRLPKVKNRYNRIKQRINKQNSLRIHKPYSNQ